MNCNPGIRKNSPDSVIVVGTPEYDRNLGSPLLCPLEYDNVMYVLHFYTATHDEGESLGIGTNVNVTITSEDHCAKVSGIVTDVQEARKTKAKTQTIEILDFGSDHYEYLEHLYDRIPTLPQSLYHDFGILAHLWQNIAHRVARTAK